MVGGDSNYSVLMKQGGRLAAVRNVAEQRGSKFKCSKVQRKLSPFKSFKPFNRFAPFKTLTDQSSFKGSKFNNAEIPFQGFQTFQTFQRCTLLRRFNVQGSRVQGQIKHRASSSRSMLRKMNNRGRLSKTFAPKFFDCARRRLIFATLVNPDGGPSW
jgi:hypothetical protein